MDRVIAYIDGFNLYFGLKSKGWRRYYWLDVRVLAQQRLVKPHQQLVEVNYFTSLVSASPSGTRQAETPDTLPLGGFETLPDLRIFHGHFLQNQATCNACGSTRRTYSEKMTDVNIATELLTDAFLGRFDTALLISADSDLKSPLTKVRSLFPSKRVVVAFPPNRCSDVLARNATASLHIGRAKIAASQLPEQVTKPDGYVLRRPGKSK